MEDRVLESQVSLAVERDLLVGLAPLIIGLLITGALIGAVAYGMRLRSRGDMRQSGPEPPHPANPREYDEEETSPVEMPRDGRRRLPHEIKDYGETEDSGTADGKRRKWNKGSSGGFGSGGPGHT